MILDVQYIVNGILIVKPVQKNRQNMCAKSGEENIAITYLELVEGKKNRAAQKPPVSWKGCAASRLPDPWLNRL